MYIFNFKLSLEEKLYNIELRKNKNGLSSNTTGDEVLGNTKLQDKVILITGPNVGIGINNFLN
jgi:hypothetical protein